MYNSWWKDGREKTIQRHENIWLHRLLFIFTFCNICSVSLSTQNSNYLFSFFTTSEQIHIITLSSVTLKQFNKTYNNFISSSRPTKVWAFSDVLHVLDPVLVAYNSPGDPPQCTPATFYKKGNIRCTPSWILKQMCLSRKLRPCPYKLLVKWYDLYTRISTPYSYSGHNKISIFETDHC